MLRMRRKEKPSRSDELRFIAWGARWGLLWWARLLAYGNIIHPVIQLWTWHVIRECGRDGGGWWDGKRQRARAERSAAPVCGLASKFRLVPLSRLVIRLPVSLYLSPSLRHYSMSPLPPSWLPVSSLARRLATSVLILSVWAQLQLQLLTAHHLGLDHCRLVWLHCVEGLLGLIPLQMIPFLFETQKDRSLFILQ